MWQHPLKDSSHPHSLWGTCCQDKCAGRNIFATTEFDDTCDKNDLSHKSPGERCRRSSPNGRKQSLARRWVRLSARDYCFWNTHRCWFSRNIHMSTKSRFQILRGTNLLPRPRKTIFGQRKAFRMMRNYSSRSSFLCAKLKKKKKNIMFMDVGNHLQNFVCPQRYAFFGHLSNVVRGEIAKFRLNVTKLKI